MSEHAKKIKIDHVHGGSLKNQQALKRNYFLATGVHDTYQLLTPSDEVIATIPPVVATGFDFSFTLKEMPKVTWTISNFDISEDAGFAKGDWTNTDQIEQEEGSFQAQSGPGLPEDESYSATA
jgi:hypothetical protein